MSDFHEEIFYKAMTSIGVYEAAGFPTLYKLWVLLF